LCGSLDVLRQNEEALKRRHVCM